MSKTIEKIIDISVDDHMKTSYINYALSVITDRAVADVRDGFKPVHRRILYAMRKMNLTPDRQTQKSAGVVGDVLKNFHPHGDSSVYDAAVRMAQPWSLSHPLIYGQGNFGSREGDKAAAYRYTEMKISHIGMNFFEGIDKENVDFRDNFDKRIQEPKVLPVAFPNILVNGTDGIAVGMTSFIPPHNLREVADSVFAYLDDRAISALDIAKILKGPDFPTGGIVHDLDGYQSAVETGRGSMKLRSTWHEEETKKNTLLVIDSMPYQSNIKKVVEKMAEVINEKRVEDVTDLRDESRATIRIVVELKRGASAELTFNKLMSCGTGLEISISYNAILLSQIEGKENLAPSQMGIIEIISKWVEFRIETIRRAAEFDLKAARARLHILEGLLKALNMLDKVIATIRKSQDGQTAKAALIQLLKIDDIQSQAILDMRLQRLTGLEINTIREEQLKNANVVQDLSDFVLNRDRQEKQLRDDLREIAEKYGRPRITEVQHSLSRISRADLVEREEVIVIITKGGYVKRIPVSAMQKQNRGTRGKSWMNVGDEDIVENVHTGSTHDYLLAVTASGKLHARKVFDIPEGKSGAKGRHVRNVLEGMGDTDRIVKMLTVPAFSEDLYIVTVSQKGQIKRTPLSDVSGSLRASGMNLLTINEDDALASVDICREHDHIMIVASNGRCVRFVANSEQMRPMGRNAVGSRGIRIDDEDSVVGMVVIHGNGQPQGTVTRTIENDDGTESEIEELDTETMDDGTYLFTIGELGIGKRTPVSEFTARARGGKGTICFNTLSKTGPLVKALKVDDTLDVIMVSERGVTNRIAVTDIRRSGRITSGTKLMNMDKNDTVIEVSTVVHEEDIEEETEA